MNCHGDNTNTPNNDGNGHKGHMSHILMMVLCCAVPAIILLGLPLISKSGNTGISNALLVVTPFLCPLMMLFMMPMMFKHNKDKGNNR